MQIVKILRKILNTARFSEHITIFRTLSIDIDLTTQMSTTTNK